MLKFVVCNEQTCFKSIKLHLLEMQKVKKYIYIYYIDTSVLLENIPLVKFIKLHPGPEWFIFHNLTREFIDDVISVISFYYFIDVFLSI